MTLSDVESQRHVLARYVRIVGEQLRTGGAAESIEYLRAGALYEMPDFECPNPRLSFAILWIRVNLLPGLT